MLFDHIERYAMSLAPADRRIARGVASARRDRERRRGDARALSRIRARRRRAGGSRAHAGARAEPGLAHAGASCSAEYRADARRSAARRHRRSGRRRSRLLAQRPARARPAICRGPKRERGRPRRARRLSSRASTAPRRTRVSSARLTSGSDDDVEIAQVYLRHRPIADADELRTLTARDRAHEGRRRAGARARDAGRPIALADHESLDELARLFPQATSIGVQRAIAGILIRGDYRAIAQPDARERAPRAPAQVARRRGRDRRADPSPADVAVTRGNPALQALTAAAGTSRST